MLCNHSRDSTFRLYMACRIGERVQLGVYIRFLNIPIPGSYVTSANEIEFLGS